MSRDRAAVGGRSRLSSVVMPGLDPGIHSVALADVVSGYGMDCRVKPGNDDINLGGFGP